MVALPKASLSVQVVGGRLTLWFFYVHITVACRQKAERQLLRP